MKTITSFHLGILTLDFIFGKKLILKGIENPPPSVIERLNPILENERELLLTEDNEKIFNNEGIFKTIYEENKNNKYEKRFIPCNIKFSLFLTSRKIFNVGLSEAFRSRCTIINCPNYESPKFLSIKYDIDDNHNKICNNILKNDILENEIKILNKKLKIKGLKFIRWCKTIKNIYDSINKNIDKYDTELCINKKINIKYIIGISALRSFIDKNNSNERIDYIKTYF